MEIRKKVMGFPLFLLCHSKNKPPAMQGEGRSLDKSMSSCARIREGLQTTNKIAQEVLRMDNNSLAHTKWECKYHIGAT